MCSTSAGDPTTTLVCTELTCETDAGDCGDEHAICSDTSNQAGYVCNCEEGYFGFETHNTGTSCVENTCSPIHMTELGEGIVASNENGNPCFDGLELSAVTNPSCELKCDEGYYASSDVTSFISCDIDGGGFYSDLICLELTCANATCGDNAECSEGSSGDGYLCSCIEGYSGYETHNEGATCTPNTFDCAGVFGGLAYEDECGVCDDDVTNDCVMDCNGACCCIPSVAIYSLTHSHHSFASHSNGIKSHSNTTLT